MATGAVTWSQTAASNATADSAANFAEGMAPSALNDSARGLMASFAKWRDDLNGSLTTGGSSAAYTLTTNQGLGSLTAGYEVGFSPHTSSGGTATLNVDSLGAKPLRSAPNVELQYGQLISGTPYRATYFTSNSGEWIVQTAASAGVPAGVVVDFAGSTAPAGWLLSYGQAVSRTTYAALFAAISTTHGAGDSSTTFNLPDYRGRDGIGKDDMGGSAASRITNAGCGIVGTTLGVTGGAQSVILDTTQIPAHTHLASSSSVSASGTTGSNSVNHTHTGTTGTNSVSHTHTVAGSTLGGGAGTAGFTGTNGSNFTLATGNDSASHTHDFTTGNNSASHTHDVTVTGTAAAQTIANNTGGGGAHANVQPGIVVNKIIKT